MILLSETNLKPHEKFFIQIYRVYQIDRFPNLKEGTVISVRIGIPHAHVDLRPFSR